MTIEERLFALQDTKYRQFNSSLLPGIDRERVIGVRNPQLRQLAKEIAKEKPLVAAFLSSLPHHYLEEETLHAILVSGIKDFDECLSEVERFLPYVDNWATCDSLRPRCFAKHTSDLLPHIKGWLHAEHEYTVRFGIGMLERFFLGFCTDQLQWVARIDRKEYYIRMMQAWYFATALAKQWDAALPVIQSLPDWVRRKTIQKACESFRVSDAHKTTLKKYR